MFGGGAWSLYSCVLYIHLWEAFGIRLWDRGKGFCLKYDQALNISEVKGWKGKKSQLHPVEQSRALASKSLFNPGNVTAEMGPKHGWWDWYLQALHVAKEGKWFAGLCLLFLNAHLAESQWEFSAWRKETHSEPQTLNGVSFFMRGELKTCLGVGGGGLGRGEKISCLCL